MRLLTILFLWAATSSAGEISKIIDHAKFLPKAHRIDWVSAQFLGRPYTGGPLGEGSDGRFDQDPLYRADRFDCTTYLETVMAISFAESQKQFETLIDHIRYESGVVSYSTRNHFTELDWIPLNARDGWIMDVTRDLAHSNQVELKTAKGLIHKPNWYLNKTLAELNVPGLSPNQMEARLLEWRDLSKLYTPQNAELPYISTADILKMASKIPSGTVFNVVREKWFISAIGTELLVSHQGFVIQKPEGTFLRHASTGKEVLDVEIKEYLERYLNHPTIRGLNLLTVSIH